MFTELRQKIKAANDNPDMLSGYTDEKLTALAQRWLYETEQMIFYMKIKSNEVLSPQQSHDLYVDAELELQEIKEAIEAPVCRFKFRLADHRN